MSVTKIRYEQLDDIYNEIKTSINNINEYITKSSNVVTSLKNNWQGDGYNLYKEKFDKVINNFSNFCSKLNELNDTIEKEIMSNKAVDNSAKNSVQGG